MIHPAPCLFCRIAAGVEPADVVLETSGEKAFLDHRPVFAGHVLVVPRTHRASLADLSPEEAATLFVTARRIATAMPAAPGCDGAFVAVNDRVSQSVPHVHVHVVPRRRRDGLRGFFWPRTRYASDEERRAVAAKLREALV